ncbi:MAG: PepSY domain-containing protein [Acidimicrobiales bacterium]
MTDTLQAPDADQSTGPVDSPRPQPAASGSGGDSSRQWRSLWRMHFYAGMFAIPFMLLMATTGLVILYTQPIHDALEGDVRTVARGTQTVSYDEQAQAVETAYPDLPVLYMITPPDDHHATAFGVDDGANEVYVDPYTGEVLGKIDAGGGIVGLANRLHGFFNNETFTVSLPTVSALWDGEAVMRPYVVSDLVLEVLGVWTIVLMVTGLYLWMPRRSRNGGDARNGRGWFSLRLQKKGRARWRDLHGLSGLVMIPVLALTIVSGMGWSTYWGPNFGSLADKLTPGNPVDPPTSEVATRGDLDRLGNRITWNTGDRPIPASYAPAADVTMPAPVSLDTVTAIADDEGMLPGYTVFFPTNATDEQGAPTFGAFTMSNSWPRKTGEARDLSIDQFTGETLTDQTAYGLGTIGYGMDVLVSTHMGTQLGIVSRIFMTLLCVLAIWSSISALIMFTKRRRPGTLGLPKRPADVRLSGRVKLVGVTLGVLFPQWAATALVILGFDRFLIRRVRPLRLAFGQR